jgi:predicted flap endonuclease-1-like 5' DNA nuclease
LRRGHVKQANISHPPAKVKPAKPMSDLNQTLDRPSDNGDDLQQIKGIGDTVEQALHSLDIHCYADLVNFTPDSLADLLKVKIPSISPKRIARGDWIGQARMLARQAKVERTQPEGQATEEAKKSKKSPTYPAWRHRAGFTVLFEHIADERGKQAWRTRVHHEEADKEESFSGTEAVLWANWILEQAELPAIVEPTSAKTEAPEPAAPDEAQIEILDVQVSETGPSSSVPEKRLRVDVCFQISGAKAEALVAERIPFRVEVHTVDLKEGTLNLVASGLSRFQPKIFEYTSQQTFPIPELGHYELHVLVLVLPPGEMMTYHRDHTLKVVP